MKNASPPNHAGTQSGRLVLTQPRLVKRMNFGIRVTMLGSIIVDRTIVKRMPRPGKRRRAKAKPAIDDVRIEPAMLRTTMTMVFHAHIANGRRFQVST